MKQKNTIGNLNKTKDLIDNGRRDWKWVSGENRCVTAKICRATLTEFRYHWLEGFVILFTKNQSSNQF